MYNRRRGRSSSKQPAQPTSAAALIAATTVYRLNTSSPDPHLAAAAAGAALRHVTVTPTPPGTIQTKRMLQRRESYSSATSPSDSENGPRRVQRSHSTSSLTERRFRKPKPLPPPSPPAQQQQYYQRPRATGTRSRNKESDSEYFPTSSSGDSDTEEDSSARRSTSVRSTSSNLSFPLTLRSPTALDRKLPKPKHASPTRSMLSRGSLRDPKPAPPSYSGRFHRRTPEPDLMVQGNRRKIQQPNENVCQAEYTESVRSITGSELGSIVEEDERRTAGRTIRNIVPPGIKDEGSEDQDHTFNFRLGDKIGAARRPPNKALKASPILRAVAHTTSTSPPRNRNSILSLPPDSPERTQSHRREQSHSPSRTQAHFLLDAAEGTHTKHSPPPRSVSPAKSALKHHPVSPPPVPPAPANGHLDDSPSSPSSPKARVSFSDEDSVASFIHGRAPISTNSAAPTAPPVSRSIRRTGRDAPKNGNAENMNKPLLPAIYSISPPLSSSSQENLQLEQQRTNMVGSPDGRLGYTPPETSPSSSVLGRPVPELVVVLPTPREEKDEDEAIGSAAQMPGGFPASESPPADAAAQVREDGDDDSDGASIYSDAYEDLEESALPSIIQVAGSREAPSSPSFVPRTQPQPSTTNPPDLQNDTQTPQTNLTKSYKKDFPPLPPDFIPAYTSTTTPSSSRLPQAPIRTNPTSSSSSDAASITSISSFKRAHPRQPRTGMRSTMRSDSPPSVPSVSRPRQKPAAFHKQKPKQTKPTFRRTSRIPDSSDEDDDGYQRPAFQSRFADSDDEDSAIGVAAGAGAGRVAKLRRKRTNSSTFSKKEENVVERKRGFWGRFGKKEKKDEPKGKEPGVIGSRSEGAAPVVVAAAMDNVAKPPARTRTIRKQKPCPGPEAEPVSARAESPPPPRAKEKKGWKRFFGNG